MDSPRSSPRILVEIWVQTAALHSACYRIVMILAMMMVRVERMPDLLVGLNATIKLNRLFHSGSSLFSSVAWAVTQWRVLLPLQRNTYQRAIFSNTQNQSRGAAIQKRYGEPRGPGLAVKH